MTKTELRDELERLRGELKYEREKAAKAQAPKDPDPRGWVPVSEHDKLALAFKQFFRTVDQEIFTDDDINAARKVVQEWSWDYFRAKGMIS